MISPTTYYGYDADGNLEYVTDPRGAGNALAGTTGDKLHDMVFLRRAQSPDVRVDALADTTFASDVTPSTQPANSTMTTYDNLGDVLTVTQSVDGATTRTTSIGYDNLGRKISETDPQVTNGLTGLPVTPMTKYSYDLNGNLLSTTDPGRRHDLDGLRRLEPPDQDGERRRQRPQRHALCHNDDL